VDARRAASGILGNHAEDQIPNLLGGRSSASLLRNPGNQPPIQKEPSSMPAHDRFWGDDEERPLPTGPDSPSNDPEEPVETAQAWPRMAPLQNGKLLAQSQIFDEETSLRAKEANHRPNEKSDESKHGKELYQNAGATPAAMLLIPMPAAVLANHRVG
jgi:hypothetical protein